MQVLPEGQFITEIGNEQFEGVIRTISGDAAVSEWRHLQEVMRPLAKAATTLPPAAIRLDPGMVLLKGAWHTVLVVEEVLSVFIFMMKR